MKRGDVLAVHGWKTGSSFNVTYQEEGQCRGCEAFIIWAKTEKFRLMPLDAWPGADGVYTSHFASCPAHAEFRKERR